MIGEKIIRAWKDPEFRMGLSEEDRSELPENPAGAIELTDEELDLATGGHIPSWYHPYQSQSSNPSSNSSSRSYSSQSARSSSFSSSQSNYPRLQPWSSSQPQSSWRGSSSSFRYRR